MNDLKFIVREYLLQLRERDELDAILPDLLRVMGYRIEKEAFRGEVEHGVDIAAFRSDETNGELFLIQVKAGDLDKNLWDSGSNSVRASLNNMIDVKYEDYSKPYLAKACKKFLLVHNGVLRENQRQKLDGYIQKNFPNNNFERWDIGVLCDLFNEHLLSERLILPKQQNLLKRVLIFLDMPDYDFSDYNNLLSSFKEPFISIGKNKEVSKMFAQIRLILSLIGKTSERKDYLSGAIIPYEETLLKLWGWAYESDKFSEAFYNCYLSILADYLSLLFKWIEKISPAILVEDGLFLSSPSEKVEYPLRTFSVIGHLSILSLSYKDIPNEGENVFLDLSNLLARLIHSNPSRHRPLLDNHSIDICMGLLCLYYANLHEVAEFWLDDLLGNIIIRKKAFDRYPELYNNIDAVLEYEATNERPISYVDSSSTLIYLLFEMIALFDFRNLYDKYKLSFDDVSLQVWYPPENIEEHLYYEEVQGGDMETMIKLPKSYDDFLSTINLRYDLRNYDELSPYKQSFPLVFYIASRHFRTPLIPDLWRKEIFKEK